MFQCAVGQKPTSGCLKLRVAGHGVGIALAEGVEHRVVCCTHRLAAVFVGGLLAEWEGGIRVGQSSADCDQCLPAHGLWSAWFRAAKRSDHGPSSLMSAYEWPMRHSMPWSRSSGRILR